MYKIKVQRCTAHGTYPIFHNNFKLSVIYKNIECLYCTSETKNNTAHQIYLNKNIKCVKKVLKSTSKKKRSRNEDVTIRKGSDAGSQHRVGAGTRPWREPGPLWSGQVCSLRCSEVTGFTGKESHPGRRDRVTQ